MKKIDKLILTSFIGPFVLTFLVVVFILLLQHMLKYFDDIIGKDLGWDVVGSLLFYFAIFMTPLALPLAVLLSSLITFGNLSEHFEITAVKSLGISLVRSLVPIFFFVLFLTGIAFYANNNWVPKAALEAYSLMYDIKQKKPALDLEEGAFYNGIPDMSIKVGHKFPDGKTIKDVIIYDHRGRSGNREVTIADSGRMFTILNDQYLKLELFNGTDYLEGQGEQNVGAGASQETLRRTQFGKTELVFDLSSFGLSRTDKKWFQGNRIMRNVIELDHDMDSVNNEIKQYRLNAYNTKDLMFGLHSRTDTIKLPPELVEFRLTRDTSARIKKMGPYLIFASQGPPSIRTDQLTAKVVRASDSLYKVPYLLDEVSRALSQTRMVKSQLQNMNSNRTAYWNEYKIFRVQWHKILSNSIACIVMFLIGAPLGAIIKKGGLGVPVIVSIFFFILFYLISSTGEKWAGQDKISVPVGIWAADFILMIVGLLFLRQARVDARLFDADFYRVVWERFTNWWDKKRVGMARR
ncbi:MAG TPA: LptF/LptG family permease [Cyclobacteriaceae bacterium]|nr:LptF/LptG family permease [Cyclobacteriaceae bacterium]